MGHILRKSGPGGAHYALNLPQIFKKSPVVCPTFWLGPPRSQILDPPLVLVVYCNFRRPHIFDPPPLIISERSLMASEDQVQNCRETILLKSGEVARIGKKVAEVRSPI